jgi:hypothetical protein
VISRNHFETGSFSVFIDEKAYDFNPAGSRKVLCQAFFQESGKKAGRKRSQRW